MILDPEQRFLQQVASQSGDGGVMAVEFACSHAGREEPETLVALYEWLRQEGRAVPARFLVTDQVAAVLSSAETDNLDTIADRLDVPVFDLVGPALLEPVYIAKPWGREIWFTGIEQRGVSRIGDGRSTIPLPWYLHAAPRHLASGRHETINLLKILDPLPEPLLGDLYFELHRQKQEVYVVTAIDRAAWPEGRGAIRLGFDPEVRDSYGSDGEFRAAYRDAVFRYREVRLQIDALIDRMREEEGIALNYPVEPGVQRRWMTAVPEPLRAREQALRVAMESFTRLWPLQVGEVVQVPLQTPHALQHGVRTVEFQTPVYERKILSFGQKVLTQSDWDTDEAVAEMKLDVTTLSRCDVLAQEEDWQLERIVTFDDFVVDRLSLKPAAEWCLEPGGEYCLLMAVGASFAVGKLSLAHERACFVPAARTTVGCRNLGTEPAALLIARPR